MLAGYSVQPVGSALAEREHQNIKPPTSTAGFAIDLQRLGAGAIAEVRSSAAKRSSGMRPILVFPPALHRATTAAQSGTTARDYARKLPAAPSMIASASAMTAGVWAREKPLWPGGPCLV